MDWKNECYSLISKLPTSAPKLNALVSDHFPSALFKYRSFDEKGHWKDWVGGTIIAPPPTSFNDPFDSIVTFAPTTNKQILKENLLKVLTVKGFFFSSKEAEYFDCASDPIAAICEIFRQRRVPLDPSQLVHLYDSDRYADGLRTMLRVTCFSEVNDEILMWGHYSRDHTGFCVQYDLSADEDMRPMTYPVIYSNRRPVILPQTWSDQSWALPTMLIKAEQWGYEREWRYLNASILATVPHMIKADPFIYCCSNIPVPAVYLGAKCELSSENVKELIKIAEANGTKVYKMKLSSSEFAVYPEPL